VRVALETQVDGAWEVAAEYLACGTPALGTRVEVDDRVFTVHSVQIVVRRRPGDTLVWSRVKLTPYVPYQSNVRSEILPC